MNKQAPCKIFDNPQFLTLNSIQLLKQFTSHLSLQKHAILSQKNIILCKVDTRAKKPQNLVIFLNVNIENKLFVKKMHTQQSTEVARTNFRFFFRLRFCAVGASTQVRLKTNFAQIFYAFFYLPLSHSYTFSIPLFVSL